MARPAAPPSRPFVVGVATEPVSAYGRSILRGVIRYANLQRHWVLHKDMWLVNYSKWPRCDGTIIGGLRAEMFPQVQKFSRLLISCSGSYNPADMPVVCLDDNAAGAMAASHLLEKGLQHFAYYGFSWIKDTLDEPRTRHAVARRAKGFVDALKKHRHTCFSPNVDPSYEDLVAHSHHRKVIDWLRSLPKPIGILAVDDTFASDLAEACRSGAIPVPDHVAIIGVNNDDLLCESAFPPLTSIECNFSRMGFLAARMMDRMLRGQQLKPEERLTELPPVSVHQRSSTDILAIDQPDVVDALRFIRDHACDPCSVDDVLRAVPVSRRTLERQFSATLGRTLHDEITRVRFDTARRLLTQSDLSVDEIAPRCGFAAVQSFVRAFRESEGATPAAFRRRSQI